MSRGIADRGVWLEPEGGEAHNPYFGADHAMADCWSSTWRITPAGLEEVDE